MDCHQPATGFQYVPPGLDGAVVGRAIGVLFNAILHRAGDAVVAFQAFVVLWQREAHLHAKGIEQLRLHRGSGGS